MGRRLTVAPEGGRHQVWGMKGSGFCAASGIRRSGGVHDDRPARGGKTPRARRILSWAGDSIDEAVAVPDRGGRRQGCYGVSGSGEFR